MAAFENRIPLTIWLMIVSVSLVAVFARGLTLGRRFWLTSALAPITIALAVALIAISIRPAPDTAWMLPCSGCTLKLVRRKMRQ